MIPSSKIKPSLRDLVGISAICLLQGIGRRPGSMFHGSESSRDSKYNSIVESVEVIGPDTGGTMYCWLRLIMLSPSSQMLFQDILP